MAHAFTPPFNNRITTSLLQLQIPHQHGRGLGAGGAVLRVEAAAAALHDARAARPLHRRDGVLADLQGVGVGQDVGILTHRHIRAALLRVAIQNRRELLAGDGRVRLKRRVARAGDDALGRRPADGLGVPSALCHIVKRHRVVYNRLACLPVQDGDQHRAGHRAVRRESRGRRAVHQLVLVSVVDRVIVPVAFRDIRERERLGRPVAVVDDNGVLARVRERQADGAVRGDARRGFKFQRARIIVVQIRPKVGVFLAQRRGQRQREAELALMGEGQLHCGRFAGDGVDDVDRDGARVHGHAQIDVRQVGARRNVLPVDRPRNAARHGDLERHVAACQRLENLLIQLSLAGFEGDLDRRAVLGALDLVRGLLAGGFGGGGEPQSKFEP